MHACALANPGMRGLIVRKAAASLGSTALTTWRERVVPEALMAGIIDFYGGSPQHPAQYRYANGSVVVLGGMDKAIKIMSSEYDLIYTQEATELTRDDWESLTTRLRHGVMSFQQLLADCNPDAPWHWLRRRADEGRTKILDSRHEDNPTLFREDGTMTDVGVAYMGKLDALTGVRYLRLRKGLWAAAEGVIYEGFDPAVHVIDSFKIPEHWTIWWSVDFGYTNPFVWQMWAQAPGDGALFLVREIYQTKRTVDEHAVKILEQVSVADRSYVHPEGRDRRAFHGRRWLYPKPQGIICDHDAGDRALLEREIGLGTLAATKTVTGGIQLVEQRLRKLTEGPHAGKPRLYLFRDALVERDPELEERKKPCGTAEEFAGYVWAKPSAGRAPKETPVKEDDHGMDATRYLVAELDMRSRPSVRFLGGGSPVRSRPA